MDRSRIIHTASSSHVAPTVAEVQRAIFADAPGSSEVFVAGLGEESTAALVDVLTDLDEPPTVRLVARESLMKWLRRDFRLASTAADLVADETLSLRATEYEFESGLVVGEESVISIITTNDRVAGLGTDDAELVESMRERCDEAWESSISFNLRTPARSRVYETLGDECGSEVEEDFRVMLEAVETTRSGGSERVMTTVSMKWHSRSSWPRATKYSSTRFRSGARTWGSQARPHSHGQKAGSKIRG